MDLARAEAIVLKTAAYREADLRVVFFTAAHGKLAGVARGARKSRRRFAGLLEALNLVRLEWKAAARGGMVAITDAAPERLHPQFREDVVAMAAGTHALELVDKLTEEHEPHPALFDGLRQILDLLAAGAPPDALLRAFELKVVSVVGYRPSLDRCARCGGEVAGAVRFSVEAGGAVCAGCVVPGPSRRLRPETLAVMRRLLARPLAEIAAWTLDGSTLRELRAVVPEFVERISGKRLRSLEILDAVRPPGPAASPGLATEAEDS